MTTTPTAIENREELLDEVLAAYLEAVRLGQAPSRQELVKTHPELAAHLGAFFADQDCLDCLVAPLRAVRPVAPPDRTGQTVGGYEILEEIARGGMGVVYKARQCSANRIVALKMLRGTQATQADLQRFRAEVEAVAHLDHPHIVPIYEVGDQDGQPYFSMKLIEGGSLAAVRSQESGVSKENQRDAAGLVAQVARAVHYAHQRGILHRDLKPGNILLDASGQPHVTDFGLAKRLGEETALTQTGAIIGTPSYMAPEQAGGIRRGVTIAADVYALGAILYELLTGRPPFRAETPLATLLLVQEKQPESPRTHCPGLSRDLETICLKCLEKEPGRRYVSAADLADDLERYLGGEPIRARPAGPAGRLWRWCRRRPVVAGLSVALLFSLVGGLGLALWKGHEAEANLREADEQKELAQNHATRAEERFLLAHRAVNDFCSRVEAELANTPGLQPVRRKLLQEALTYYKEFLRQRGDDPGLRAELADAYHRIAWITAEVGSKAEALAAHQQTQCIYQALVAADPDNESFQVKLASAYHNVAMLQVETGQVADGTANYEKAIALTQDMVRRHPADRQQRYFLANSFNNLANLHRKAGRNTEAIKLHNKARDLRAQLVKEDPKNPQYRSVLASTLQNLGVAHESVGKHREALELYEQARDLRLQLTRDHPKASQFRGELAASWHTVGVAQERLGDRAKALKAYEQALTLREELARAHPGVTGHQLALASSHYSLGVAHGAYGQYARALASHRRAVDILQRLAKKDPSFLAVQADLGRTFFGIGVEANRLRRPKDALDAYLQARAAQEKVVKAEPENLGYRHELSQTLGNLGLTYTRLGRHGEARETIRLAIEQAKVPFAKAPGVANNRRELSRRYGALANVEERAGRPIEAAAALKEASKLWVGNGHELAQHGREIARLAAEAGKARPPRADAADIRRIEDVALALLAEALAVGYKDFEQLRASPDFDGLRKRPEFGKLLPKANQ
jgi:tetratricopeptide (TPR) repeat protein/tRNA A-37 threonylcarbamoyl transferase component Bud32